MSHDIYIDNGRAHIAYVGDTPWHGLGHRVEENITGSQMQKSAGLDWSVHKEALPDVAGQKDRRYKVVRLAEHPKEFSTGTVGSEFEPLQNSDAFKYFEPVLDKLDGRFEVAGSLGHGERVWILGLLNRQDKVTPDDRLKQYVLLSSRHDGLADVELSLTPVRVVCDNTLSLSHKWSKGLCFRHDTQLLTKLADTAALCEAIRQQKNGTLESYRKMARTIVDDSIVDFYLNRVFGLTSRFVGTRRASRPRKLGSQLAIEREQVTSLQLSDIDTKLRFARIALFRSVAGEADNPTRQAQLARMEQKRQYLMAKLAEHQAELDRLEDRSPDGPSTVDRQRSVAKKLFEAGRGNQLRGVRGTLWAAYNAVTETIDHTAAGGLPVPDETSPDGGRRAREVRFESLVFGDGRRLKQRALSVAIGLMEKGVDPNRSRISLQGVRSLEGWSGSPDAASSLKHSVEREAFAPCGV